MSLSDKVYEEVNQNTKECSQFYDLARALVWDYKKLDDIVTPQLEEIDFYGGRSLPENDYTPDTAWIRQHLENQRKSNSRLPADLKNILRNFKSGHISFIGPAGMGKTTLINAICRKVLNGELQGLKDVKLVCYVQCKDFDPNKPLKPCDLLFSYLKGKLDDKEIKKLMDNVKSFPNKVLIAIDSLDTLRYNIDGVYENIELDGEACPEALLCNLLSGELIPGCRIITSSREHAIRNYHGKVRPDKVIALIGLTKNDIMEVTKGYIGKDAATEFIEFLRKNSPALLNLCSVPAVLVYTLVAWKIRPNLECTTMTGIMVIVVASILRSPHTHQENLSELLQKLEELSYIGTSERRVLFTTEDLMKINLHPGHVHDVMIRSPQHAMKILSGQHVLYFNHQSLQEIFTALWIYRMKPVDFKDFVKKSLHKSELAVVCRMLCGILFNNEVQGGGLIDEKDEDDLKKMRNIVRKSFFKHLRANPSGADLLELFNSLNEGKDGMKDIIKTIDGEISLTNIPLTHSDALSIGSVTSQCNVITSLDLSNCALDHDSSGILFSTMLGSEVKIDNFVLRGNPNLGFGKLLIDVIKQTNMTKLNLEECGLNAKKLECLSTSGISSTNLKSLKVSLNPDIGEAVGMLADIVIKGIKDLEINYCMITDSQLQILSNKLEEANELEYLSISTESEAAKVSHTNSFIKLIPLVKNRFVFRGWKFSEDDRKELCSKKDEYKDLEIHFDDDASSEYSKAENRGRKRKCMVKYNEVQGTTMIKVNYLFKDVDVLRKNETGCKVYVGGVGSSIMERKEVVIKSIDKQSIEKPENFRREADMMSCLPRHPNVVVFHHAEEENGREPKILLVLEKCHDLNLHDRIKSWKGKVHSSYCKTILHQVAFGVHHLHSYNIIHRDLKPQNILFSEDEKVVRVSDFGMSKKIPDASDQASVSSYKIGTFGWRAPELLTSKSCDLRCDSFSFGLLMYNLLSGNKHAFRGQNDNDDNGMYYSCEERIKNKDKCYPPSLTNLPCEDPHIAEDLIEKTLKFDPKERPPMDEILEHPYFWDFDAKLEMLVRAGELIEVKYEKESWDELKKIAQSLNDPQPLNNWKNCLRKIAEDGGGESSCKAFCEKGLTYGDNANKVFNKMTDGKQNCNQQSSEDLKETRNTLLLLKFIRNKIVHFAGECENYCQSGKWWKSKSEMWTFLSKTFPFLFINIYNSMKQELSQYIQQQKRSDSCLNLDSNQLGH